MVVGGEEGLGLAVTGTSLEVTGSPSVTGASTLQVFGPLLLSLPLVGGGGVASGSVLVLTDDFGNDVIFEFVAQTIPPQPTLPGSISVPFNTFDTVDVIADNLVLAINAANVGIPAQNLGIGRVSLGRIDSGRVNINGIVDPADPTLSIPGLTGVTLRRGIVNDGEVMSIRQGSVLVSFEFEASVGGGGTAANNVPVVFQPGSSVGDVALSLAASINNNKGNLRINAVPVLDVDGNPTGEVTLNDQPGTVIDVVLAPTLNLIGVPGGATPIRISPAFSATEVKFALINAINSVNPPNDLPVTTLSAEDRGGATFFVNNGEIFTGPLSNFSLQGIKDFAGNALEANRDDLSTQFTILMPGVGLDFGDAPDPVLQVQGRYPTQNANNGPRHVVDDKLFLGNFIDADVDGVPGDTADGDDLMIAISNTGTLFGTSLVDGSARIVVQSGSVSPLTRDGDTITIDTGVAIATLEFDVNGRFDEDNFAIRPTDPTSASSITEAIIAAINESPIEPASISSTSATVLVNADDEDGVVFTSPTNPAGVLNRGVATPIEVSVTGAGILEAWIDFNADGDWNDPGEQIIPMSDSSQFSDLRSQLCPENLTGIASNIFADSGSASSRSFCIVVPPTTPVPPGPVETYARFRVSREGNLSPTGLALSGEIEDYVLMLLPGDPPVINQPNRTYTVEEGRVLQALDANGVLTSNGNDDGLLDGVVDLQGDQVVIFSEDTGERTLLTPSGTVAGVLDLAGDGTFAFVPEDNFNGVATFTARVSDVQPIDPSTALVTSRPISVTINVVPINDPPEIQPADATAIVGRTINEDEIQTFSVDELIRGQDFEYVAGPENELGQPLIIQSVFDPIRGNGRSAQGGNVSITNGGRTVVYTPPADFNGAADTFVYVVADQPGDGQLSEAVDPNEYGTVVVDVRPVNDPPRTINDNYTGEEGSIVLIPVLGDSANPGILDNDLPGPPDEVNPPNPQTISLVANQFPKPTANGGVVELIDSNTLRYTPPNLFSGVDSFEYSVTDNLGAVTPSTKLPRVSINVGGVNNAPRFIGINGDSSQNTIVREEAKVQAEDEVYDLTTWFNDPEGDVLTFSATSSNPNVAAAMVVADTLTLRFQPFGFGSTVLTVTAADFTGASVVVQIPVTAINTLDPPSVIGTLNPLSSSEDPPNQLVVADLSRVFRTPMVNRCNTWSHDSERCPVQRRRRLHNIH